MVWPESQAAVIKSLAFNSPQIEGRKVTHVSLLGHGGKITFTQDANGLAVTLPAKPPCESAVTLKIQGVLTA
jgi:hypothetical protein